MPCICSSLPEAITGPWDPHGTAVLSRSVKIFKEQYIRDLLFTSSAFFVYHDDDYLRSQCYSLQHPHRFSSLKKVDFVSGIRHGPVRNGIRRNGTVVPSHSIGILENRVPSGRILEDGIRSRGSVTTPEVYQHVSIYL